MTAAQESLYWRLWSQAVKAQKWKGDLNEMRRAIHKELGLAESHKAFNSQADVDRVFAHFKALAGSVQGAIEEDQPELGERRRLLHVIRIEQMKFLRLYVDDPFAYVEQILRARFKVVLDARPVDDLDLTQLRQLRWTLEGRINDMRKKAGHSVHDMLTAAGVECQCRQCSVIGKPVISHGPAA